MSFEDREVIETDGPTISEAVKVYLGNRSEDSYAQNYFKEESFGSIFKHENDDKIDKVSKKVKNDLGANTTNFSPKFMTEASFNDDKIKFKEVHDKFEQVDKKDSQSSDEIISETFSSEENS